MLIAKPGFGTPSSWIAAGGKNVDRRQSAGGRMKSETQFHQWDLNEKFIHS